MIPVCVPDIAGMEKTEKFENYPFSTICLSNLVSLGIYGSGLYIMQKAGWFFALPFLLFILWFEYRLIRYHCTHCYYWGKLCGFGRGRVSAWLFKQGDPSKFCLKDMTWRDMIPDLLISIIPLLTGIVLLILDFQVFLLFAMIVLTMLMTMGNAYIRGRLTCSYCKQKELGCPADALFNKT